MKGGVVDASDASAGAVDGTGVDGDEDVVMKGERCSVVKSPGVVGRRMGLEGWGGEDVDMIKLRTSGTTGRRCVYRLSDLVTKGRDICGDVDSKRGEDVDPIR